MNSIYRIPKAKVLPALLFLCLFRLSEAQVRLNYENNETVSWQEALEMYRWLDETYPSAKLVEAGETDAGKPLHLFIISTGGQFTPEEARNAGKRILMINNGIHPGEPCGVDASLKFAADLLSGEDPYCTFLEGTVVVIVPIFNIGGALNRGSYYRANQNGPVEHGYRGNARNLDLNRDFMKLDTRNARSMVSILQSWEPDLFVDNHTSDGADYPYVITLISGSASRLEPVQAQFLENTVLPFLFGAMKETPYEMSPYVWSRGSSPESGIIGFMDYPRYTQGYAGMFNTLAFTVETHMFKPFRDRVLSAWYFMRETLRFTSEYGDRIESVRQEALDEKLQRKSFVVEWELDTTRYDMIPFRGYSAKTKPSLVTGHPRLYYDREDPWSGEIPYYRYFNPVKTVSVPDFYIVPAAYGEVTDRLKINGVIMEPFATDTVLTAEVTYIGEYDTSRRPYNGHYWHSHVTTSSETREVKVLQGDYLVPVRQEAIEYLVQALEPEGYDSFFSWNFFDGILSRNEYFSPYIFEETAYDLLNADPSLDSLFRKRQQQDPEFAGNPRQQLLFLYEHSPWSEEFYLRYPVFRLRKGQSVTDSSTE